MQQLLTQLVSQSFTIEHSIYEQAIQELQHIQIQCPHQEDIVFICIGSDQSTGDAFGPLMGTRLQQLGFPHVIGTLADPCDANKVEQAVEQLPPDKVVVAIDACLGKEKSVGSLIIQKGSIQPGAATGRRLPPVGHYSIAAVVNQNGPKAYWKIQNTSLFTVLGMVDILCQAIIHTWHLER